MDQIGTLIRTYRRNNKITLKQMAEKTQLSVSFLSEIERGVAKPSMDSLRKIARTLEISLLSFSDPDKQTATRQLHLEHCHDDDKTNPYVTKVNVVRSNRRKKLGYPDRPGYYELLTPDLNRRLEVLYVKIEPGFETGPEPIVDPAGEKFIYVLKGVYQITIHDEVYVLNAGDSIYYPADAPVFFKTMSAEPVELVFALTPPVF